MRFSHTFSATLREAPAAVSLPSQQWLTRAGFIRALTTNQFAFLPLAQRAIALIEALMRETLGSLGSQELHLPALPVDSVEETITHLTEQIVQSYRQLPQRIHHFHLALTGDRGPGLFSLPEVTAVTCYTLDPDQTGLENQTQAIVAAFQKALQSCGLSVQIALSEDDQRTFVYLTDSGPAPILSCDNCSYAAEQSAAESRKADASAEAPLPVEKVATPEMASIASLSGYLDIPASRTAKAVFYTGIFEGTQDFQAPNQGDQDFRAPVQGGQDFLATETRGQEPLLIFAMLRGDRTLSEPKLRQALGKAGKGRLVRLQPALESEIQAAGAVPGYASPIGIRQDKALVVADQALLASPNLVAGANEVGYHLRNTNLGRDYEPDIIADIAQVETGEPCPHCPGHLVLYQGVVLGHYGKLIPGSNPTFLDEQGAAQPIHLGRFEVWIELVLASVAEGHHDDAGLIWPTTIAPYPIHLVVLPSKDGASEAAAEKLYQDLIAADLAPLYDDRAERAGVKFNDADLIGLPLRITVSSRSLENGGYEFKRRDREERWIVPVEDCIAAIQDELNKLQL